MFKMTIVTLENIVQLTRMDAPSVKMFVLEDSCAVEMLSASREIIMPSANVNKDSIPMERFVGRSNVNRTTTVAMIKDVTTTCARSSVSWENLAVKMHSALLRITNKFVNVNQASLATRLRVAK